MNTQNKGFQDRHQSGARPLLLALSVGGALLAPSAVNAQGSAAALLEEIVVTATKRPDQVQNVPLAMTAFGEEKLAAINFRDVGSLGYTMPNVALDDNGTSKGYANFSIRGVGVNSSIPSLDPAVGLFVDGVYQGINAGQIFDNFDLEAVEVLRGPQGILFGRNVTGGAVLLRTKRPSQDLEVNARIAAETGLRTVTDGSVSGALVDGLLAGKIAAYYTHDDGWFTNDLDGSEFGEDEQFIIRPSFLYTPNENTEILVRLEHGEAKGDGQAAQNHAIYSRQSHDFSVQNDGFYDNEWDSLTVEANVDVGFGDGTVTNIFGWREFTGDTLTDLDGQGGFTIGTYTDQEQFSNELRYAGTFGDVDVTTGLYYFTQDLLYIERRLLVTAAGPRTRDIAGGGDGTFETAGAFTAFDWHINEQWTLNFGLRYTWEKKEASVATVSATGSDYAAHVIYPDFEDSESWTDVSPRLGFQWQPNDDTQIYGYYAKGFRSGGYNFRNTIAGAAPGPFEAEEQSAFEVGAKQQLFDGRATLNMALFHNTIDDIQRDAQVPIAGIGIGQLLVNSGEVEVQGGEVELQILATDNLVIGAHAGYTDSEYQEIVFDLTGDGVINDNDFGLKLPRQSPWTYGVNATLDIPSSTGITSVRLAYNHRDKAYHTDNNLGFYGDVNLVDANITYRPNESHFVYTLYGKNLTDETTYGNDSVMPDSPAFGGDGASGPRPLPTFSPLGRGRVVGAEVRYQF
ncbi:MAG: TonB-dependent receptor [Porticoccaceae bacterium]|nr:TonB-dependent receptor [Porticoccaceae bacterium]